MTVPISISRNDSSYQYQFTDVVKLIIDFLQPPYEALIHEEELFKNWKHERKEYESNTSMGNIKGVF